MKRLAHRWRLWRAHWEVAAANVRRLQLVDSKRWTILWTVRIVAWWIVFVGLGIFVDPATFQLYVYFPTLLALSLTWLIAAPALGQALVGRGEKLTIFQDYVSRLVHAAEAKGEHIPEDINSSETLGFVDRVFSALLPNMIPLLFARLSAWVSTRMVIVGLTSVLGMLVGPTLQSVHLGPIGWSPVRLLIAFPAFWSGAALVCLVLPTVAVRYLMEERFMSDLESLPEPPHVGPTTHGDSALTEPEMTNGVHEEAVQPEDATRAG